MRRPMFATAVRRGSPAGERPSAIVVGARIQRRLPESVIRRVLDAELCPHGLAKHAALVVSLTLSLTPLVGISASGYPLQVIKRLVVFTCDFPHLGSCADGEIYICILHGSNRGPHMFVLVKLLSTARPQINVVDCLIERISGYKIIVARLARLIPHSSGLLFPNGTNSGLLTPTVIKRCRRQA